jgi:carbamoyl-phosphate synthase large subunit
VDAVSDGAQVVIAGVMEHVERAGIHSGDSSCSLPPNTLTAKVVDELKRQAILIAKELKVVGLMNIQFAVSEDQQAYILEANPRASRTVPFVSKATSIPWAKVAARLMAGKTLRDLALKIPEQLPYRSVKACVFPFSKFPGVDTLLGPEMKSTGEVMGIDREFGAAFAKSQFAAKVNLPTSGSVIISVMNADKEGVLPLARDLFQLGFTLCATSGTARFLNEHGVKTEPIKKVREGSPHIVDLLGKGDVAMVINTPEGHGAALDSRSIRLVSNEMNIPTYTTIAAASAAVAAIRSLKADKARQVMSLQEYHAELGVRNG